MELNDEPENAFAWIVMPFGAMMENTQVDGTVKLPNTPLGAAIYALIIRIAKAGLI